LASSRRRWDAFWSSASARAVDPDSDAGRLIRWIQQVDEYERVRRVITAGPRGTRLVEGSQRQPVLNPLIPYLAELERQIAKAEDHFGMTPMSRLRLGITAAAGQVAAQRAREAQRADAAAAAGADDDTRRAAVLGTITPASQPGRAAP
jgi:P27 family predicted phage terminase small subunit